MEKLKSHLSEIKLIGIASKTSNALEMDPTKAKIGTVINRYFSENVAESIPNRKNPGITYCVYTNYESDETGGYTYFVGEQVNAFVELNSDFEKLIIPAQTYIKFTVGPGAMPAVCINAWQKIWKMRAEELGGTRAFIADFEIYDERAMDYQNTILDIYIGVK